MYLISKLKRLTQVSYYCLNPDTEQALSQSWLVVAIAGASRESDRCDYRLSQGSY
ncbi:hypothetical protein COO91_07771 [Nostoc flagelliforme CCNUN1]|uniref:Uncharacterized protein n=1 Tax=Nostoc flagelliforme CCNUN1 TaxID=2038116 RepID=A0A2K8T224_9NOSO|nr:hypothetical protein COO91_07771 [Nostoc flagelliforme CCNUN1]